MVTGAGTILALITGSMGQYRTEKYDCRRDSMQDYIIPRGNGHKHPRYSGISLNLEDLANNISRAGRRTRAIIVCLAIFWIFLLITIGGLTEDTWYLFLVEAIGMGHNIAVAGVTRTPTALGIPISHDHLHQFRLSEKNSEDKDYDPHKHRPKVMQTLGKLEEEYPGAGVALISE
ncbi:hypothetical protein B7463_g4879, partial [Scytalidium lignicola]